MKNITAAMAAGAAALAGSWGIAAMFGIAVPLAHATGDVNVGDPCAHYQNNRVMQATDGTWVRCTIGAGYPGWTWLPDTGVAAPDLPNGWTAPYPPPPLAPYPTPPPAAPSGPCYWPPTPGCPPRGLTPEQRANW
jgi:hypothetical protein